MRRCATLHSKLNLSFSANSSLFAQMPNPTGSLFTRRARRSRSQELPSLITAEAAAGLVEEVAERGADDRAAEVVQ